MYVKTKMYDKIAALNAFVVTNNNNQGVDNLTITACDGTNHV